VSGKTVGNTGGKTEKTPLTKPRAPNKETKRGPDNGALRRATVLIVPGIDIKSKDPKVDIVNMVLTRGGRGGSGRLGGRDGVFGVDERWKEKKLPKK